MQIFGSVLIIVLSCIVYMAFGSLVCINRRKDCDFSPIITMVVGFFLYYAMFSIVCLPIMLTYRKLSTLTRVWMIVVAVVCLISAVMYLPVWIKKVSAFVTVNNNRKLYCTVIFLLIVFQVILVASTYNFTLDAAYYVANVATSVDTNMINVYDPFTGAWQDHFELRYVFATYSVHDAVVCQLTHIPALIMTKTVMSGIVMVLVNLLYIFICSFLCKDDRQNIIMYIAMIFVNMTFITLYTSSNFLMSRTYEGKSIVGNITVVAVFVMYMMAVRNGMKGNDFLKLFVICLGTASISSTANMIIPAQICILFTPYILKHKAYKMIPKLVICMLPELIMLLMYVLYVKGYFAIYTYPRY